MAATSPSGVDSLMMSPVSLRDTVLSLSAVTLFSGLSSARTIRRRLLGHPALDSASVNEMFLPLTIFKGKDRIKVALHFSSPL